RRSHAGDLRVLARALEDAPVRLVDERYDAVLAGAASLVRRYRGCREAGRDLPGARAAHAVRHREKWRLAHEGVLVLPAPPPPIRNPGEASDPHRSYLRSVSPMRTTSFGASLRGRSSFV